MSQVLMMQEHDGFGLPVWRFAALHDESPHVYAPRSLGDRKGDERAWINREKVRAWVRTFAKPWSMLDLGRFGQHEYALYMPYTEQDLHWLCRATAVHGGCVEIITHEELSEQRADAIAPIWATTRPLRYLTHMDLCRVLKVRWVYLLAIYNYASNLSVFIAESAVMLQEVLDMTKEFPDCSVVPLEQAMEAEQRNWEDIYRQFDAEAGDS